MSVLFISESIQRILNSLYLNIKTVFLICFVAENVQISLTKKQHTWSQARNRCSLIGNEHTNITFPNFNSGLMWTGGSGRYSTWVEYLGKYAYSLEKIVFFDFIFAYIK